MHKFTVKLWCASLCGDLKIENPGTLLLLELRDHLKNTVVFESHRFHLTLVRFPSFQARIEELEEELEAERNARAKVREISKRASGENGTCWSDRRETEALRTELQKSLRLDTEFWRCQQFRFTL